MGVQDQKSAILHRVDGRKRDELRSLKIDAGFSPYAEGSAEVVFGSTRLLAVVSVDRQKAPADKRPGEIRASISMLPRATAVRLEDASLKGALELELGALEQLLIRSLSSSIDADQLNGLVFNLDCSILVSDAGIATAAVSGAWVALYQALRWAAFEEMIPGDLDFKRVAAISGAVLEQGWLLDACAQEAVDSSFTVTFVFNDEQKLVETRGVHESKAIAVETYNALVSSAKLEAKKIFAEQERAVLQLG